MPVPGDVLPHPCTSHCMPPLGREGEAGLRTVKRHGVGCVTLAYVVFGAR